MLETFLSSKKRRVVPIVTMKFFHQFVSQVNVNTIRAIFEQLSELEVTKGLINRALSCSYNVSSFKR